MGDTSETNKKVLSRELFLGVVALKRLYRKIIICATSTLFPGTVTYVIRLNLSNSRNGDCQRSLSLSANTLQYFNLTVAYMYVY